MMARVMSMMPLGELANPRGIVEDFESNIREELDFRREAANMTEFNRIMVEHGQTQVAAPRAGRRADDPARARDGALLRPPRRRRREAARRRTSTARRSCSSACAPGSSA